MPAPCAPGDVRARTRSDQMGWGRSNRWPHCLSCAGMRQVGLLDHILSHGPQIGLDVIRVLIAAGDDLEMVADLELS